MTQKKAQEKHSCKTYLAVCFDIDIQKNAELLRERRDCHYCLPEEIGIFNKREVEEYIVGELGITPEWNRHHFVIGYNENYNIDVNEMIRVTLKDLFGKEDKINELCKNFGVTVVLEIVPYIITESDVPSQILSLDRDIIEFLYQSGVEMDLDYYFM